MEMEMFSIYDTAPKVFSQPFYQLTKDTAIRGFADAVNDGDEKDNVYKRHPEHYSLWHLGSFDDKKGAFVLLPTPEQVIKASECIKRVPMAQQMKVLNTPVGLTPSDIETPTVGSRRPVPEPR